jgi:hypothetical protein
MHEHDRYDQLHAELASGEGMPEAHQPEARPDARTVTSAAGTTSDKAAG